jgi:hypothetical protein
VLAKLNFCKIVFKHGRRESRGSVVESGALAQLRV